MKQDEMLVLGLAAIAVWLIVKGRGAATGKPAGWVDKINVDNDGGWQYFTDGTVIDPSGAYWSNGVKVWSP
jgi:hypothetical protein